MDFKRKYPLQLQHILITPMIFRENVLLFRELPYPTLNGIRDLAEYAGFSYSAVRTALSRVRAKGEIETFKDEKGKGTRAKIFCNRGHEHRGGDGGSRPRQFVQVYHRKEFQGRIIRLHREGSYNWRRM